MSIQHGGYRHIPAPGELPPAHKRAKKLHGRSSRHKPAQRLRSTAELADTFWRLIRNLNRALDGRYQPVDQQRVLSLERQLDRVAREWEAAETT